MVKKLCCSKVKISKISNILRGLWYSQKQKRSLGYWTCLETICSIKTS